MRIDVLTLFPEMFESPLGYSILKRAQQQNIVELITVGGIFKCLADQHIFTWTHIGTQADNTVLAGLLFDNAQAFANAIGHLGERYLIDEINLTTVDGIQLDD